ncbi:MAG: 4Fe-4S binding protein [Syntrophaceae bacterium]
MPDVYERLRHRLDQMATGYPATPSGVELRILRQLFSPRDAELFISLSPELESAAEISGRLGTDQAALAEHLEDMARRGLLFRLRQDGELRYGPIPFIVGIYEFQVNRLTPTLLKDISEYFLAALAPTFHSRSTPHQRSIPIETHILAERPIAPYDDAVAIIASKERIAVAECLCRKAVRMYGKGCRHPLETCLQFDAYAEYYVDNSMARAISTDEAYAILKRNEQEGLVLQTLNSQNVEAMCACCSCCCGMLIALRLFPAPSREVMSNYVCRVDTDLCTGCGVCMRRCPTGALKLVEGRAHFKPERCIGCGLCVKTCPVQAHQLTRKPSAKLYTPPATVAAAFERMRSSAR